MTLDERQIDDLAGGELGDLLRRLHDDALDAAGEARLSALIRDDEAARTFYRHYTQLHAMMSWDAAAPATPSVAKPLADADDAASSPIAGRIGRRRVAIVGAIAAALLIAGAAIAAVLLALEPHAEVGDPGSRPSVVGVVVDAGDVTWRSEPINPGESVAQGPIAIESGSVELSLNRGTELSLTGPIDCRIDAADRVLLRRGMLRAAAQPGFTVATPNGTRIVDLGTEFAVRVGDAERTDVWVERGRVRIERPGVEAFDVAAGWVVALRGDREHRIVLPPGAVPAAVYAFEAHDGGERVEPILVGPTLSAVGGVRFEATDRAIGSAVFTAAGQRLETDRPAITDTDGWMIEATVRPDTDLGTAIVVHNGRPNGDGFGIVRKGGAWAVLFGNRAVREAAPVEVGRSVVLRLTRRGGVTRMEIDGVAVGPAMLDVPGEPTGMLLIGGTPQHAGETFIGAIGDVRVMRLSDGVDPADANVGPDSSETSRP